MSLRCHRKSQCKWHRDQSGLQCSRPKIAKTTYSPHRNKANRSTSQLIGAMPPYRAILTLLNLDKGRKGFIKRVERLMTRSHDPQERRNRIVHDAWYLHSEKDTPGQFRSLPYKNQEW